MNVLVTGGTGVLGREVVEQLVTRGHQVRILSRTAKPHPHADVVAGDLGTGDGLQAALMNVDTVVHTASDPKRPKDADVEGTQRLLAAASAAGVRHFVYISIVGVDRIPWPYYRAKLDVEQMVEAAGLPFTILRATQFHEFTLDLLSRLSRKLTIAPRGWRIQPVDVRLVAARLADAVDNGPVGRLPDLAGPEVLTWADAIRAISAAKGRRARVISVPVPGRFSAAWRDGAALAEPTPGRTFADFLAERAAR
jgi:uncharacterized protein YbjT (DUF2867 family)